MNIDVQDLAKLAREMAMLLKPRATILAEHELSEEDYAQIEKLEFYKRALETASIEWNRPMSTAERIRLIGQCYLEESLPVIGGRMANTNESLANVVDGMKVLTQISGLNNNNEKSTPASAAEKFIIQINLGADIEKYEKDITPVQQIEQSKSD